MLNTNVKDVIADSIEKTTEVLDTLSKSINVGVPPRMYEVYAKLAATLVDQCEALAKLEHRDKK